MVQTMTYQPQQFSLSGLQGISDKTLEMHFKLYEGYVKAVNELNEKIMEMLKDGRVDQDEFPAYSELTRRLGFEYNGMVLLWPRHKTKITSDRRFGHTILTK